ncbi:hypothetical protein GOV12_00315 [Candidatus Pacearchaeota archaeon]|nr:hypothetical protein [Candidatus Pacearchaeota archaeon]
MNPEALKLRTRAEELRKDAEYAVTALSNHVNSCRHNYSEPEFDPIYREAYTSPGDPPGTMGVDFRGPCHVPAKTTKRWKRECVECGDIQYTQKIHKTTLESPEFGDRTVGRLG